MAESLLYITFKDTVSDNDTASRKIAVDNIVAQMLAACERIQSDPNSIYSYLRQDSNTKLELNKNESIENQRCIVGVQDTSNESIPNITPVLTEEEILKIIFKDLKRTRKSESIVRYLVQNSGSELSADQLAAGATMTKNDLSSWMAMTGTRIPSITRPSRGVYKFNPDKLNTINNHGKEDKEQC